MSMGRLLVLLPLWQSSRVAVRRCPPVRIPTRRLENVESGDLIDCIATRTSEADARIMQVIGDDKLVQIADTSITPATVDDD